MAINTLVTRGFGNGTYSGSIALVVTRGYGIGEAVVGPPPYNTTVLFSFSTTIGVSFSFSTAIAISLSANMATNANLEIYRRETRTFTFTAPSSINGQAWALEVRHPRTNAVVIRKDATASGTSVVFTVTSTDSDITPDSYPYGMSRPGSSVEAMGAEGVFVVKSPAVAI